MECNLSRAVCCDARRQKTDPIASFFPAAAKRNSDWLLTPKLEATRLLVADIQSMAIRFSFDTRCSRQMLYVGARQNAERS